MPTKMASHISPTFIRILFHKKLSNVDTFSAGIQTGGKKNTTMKEKHEPQL